MKKITTTILLFALIVSAIPTKTLTAVDRTVLSEPALRNAIADAYTDGTPFIIEIGDALGVTISIAGAALTIGGGRNITLIGNNGTINRDNSDAASVFNVTANSTLTLDGPTITRSNGVGSGVSVTGGGHFIMERGIIRCESPTPSDNAGTRNGVAVSGENSTFTMRGGTIRNNRHSGVRVSNRGIFNLHGGYIIENGSLFTPNIPTDTVFVGRTSGGGVWVGGHSTMNMYGGTIRNNHCRYTGGVAVGGASRFYMHGGTIENNSAVAMRIEVEEENWLGGIDPNPALNSFGSGGVSLRGRNIVFNMHGGIIRNNQSPSGGGVMVGPGYRPANADPLVYYRSPIFNMYGGRIYNNHAVGGVAGSGNGGGVYVNRGIRIPLLDDRETLRGIFNMYGGTIENNEANGEGSGIFVNWEGLGFPMQVSHGHLTINGNAIAMGVRALPAHATLTRGIVFVEPPGNTGFVFGYVTLTKDFKLPNNHFLTIQDHSRLTNNHVLTIAGTLNVVNENRLTNNHDITIIEYGNIIGMDIITIINHPEDTTELTVILGNLYVEAERKLVTNDLRFQWYYNVSHLNTGGSPIIGATNPTFQIPRNLLSGTHYFYAVASLAGTATNNPIFAVSNVATVIVDRDGIDCGELAIRYAYARDTIRYLRDSVSDLLDSISDLHKSITRLLDSIAKLIESITELHEDTLRLHDSIDGLHATIRYLIADTLRLYDLLAVCDSISRDLQDTILARDYKITAILKQVETLIGDTIILHDSIQNLNDTITRLRYLLKLCNGDPGGSTKIVEITVEGISANRDGTNFGITAPCGETTAKIVVVPEDPLARVKIDGIEQNYIELDLERHGDNIFNIRIETLGGDYAYHTLTVNRLIDFDQVTIRRWGKAVSVINNPENNGGYIFNAFRWFRNDETIPFTTSQWWNANVFDTPKSPTDIFHVELGLATEDGRTIRSCESYVVLSTSVVNLFPNPVAPGQPFYVQADFDEELLKNVVLNVYNQMGSRIAQLPIRERITPINLNLPSGAHIVVLTDNEGFRHEIKVVVR